MALLRSIHRHAAVPVCLAVACLAIGLSSKPASADTELKTVTQALLDYEQNIKWAAVHPAWLERRQAWGRGVLSVGSPAALGGRILELEDAMGWSAVEESWKKTRPGWAEQTSDCEMPAQAAYSLLQLESVTKWSAVQPAWKAKRAAWVARLKKVARVK